MNDLYSELFELVVQLKSDFDDFYEKGNKAAGTRVHKGMQELNILTIKIRTDVHEKKKREV